MSRRQYESFDILDVARKGMNYITSMVDEKYDFLPYWFIQINEAPAYAKHVRVDDAELVGSWYEALSALHKMTGATDRSLLVLAGLKTHLLRSWGPHGLRFHEPYPWSNTNHASFHEMGWILAGMNRLQADEPDNAEVEKRISELVRGLRGLVLQRKIRTFWSGDFPIDEPIFEFPADIYIREGGFVPERITGRGEECIRNAVLLEPLVTRAVRRGDKVALELAEGIANHMIGLSRYFSWDSHYFGHVHSAVWFAIGLLKLGRHLQRPRYIEKAVRIFEFTKSMSSEFGWVPEYARWCPESENHCETCCIKDMVEFALEAVELGYDYWDLINKYTRNQFSEQQVKTGCFIAVDNTRPDKDGHTWRDMDQRVVGGWSGGGEPNSLSLSRFRSIAGCCVGTAPVGFWLVWEKIVQDTADGVFVNLPIDRDHPAARVETGYPNTGLLRVTARKAGVYRLRPHPWMGARLELTVDGRHVPVTYAGGCILVENVASGAVIELRHDLAERVTKETVRGLELSITWRGADVVRMDPPGLPLMLYQREAGVPKSYPKPIGTASSGPMVMKPTDQKK